MHRFRILVGFAWLVVANVALAQQPQSPLVQSFQDHQRMKSDTPYGLEWVSLGPVVNSARVESVQLDPTRPGTIYAAFGSGNLWKTSNNGLSWRPMFEDFPSHGIGDIALAPSNPDVIYLGTGESLKKARNFTIPGTGVYRSDDGGENWRFLGLEDSWHIGEIAVHPTNPDVAIVAVLGHFWSSNSYRGLFRTADGGRTWQHVLKVDENTGGNDVAWSLSDPDVVYASTWENYPGVNGKGSGVHKSLDGGNTWQPCEKGFPAGDGVGRIGLAVSQQDSNKVYALVDNRGRINDGGTAEVYRSTDGGQQWARTHEDELNIFSVIGWYFADIYVNPQDDEEVFALGVRIAHSSNGGKSFDLVGGDVAHLTPSAASGLHLDHCEMWIHPSNPNHLVLGNDGGLYQSLDKGKTWLHFNNLPTGEFYDIAVDQHSPYRIFAGAQDDATVYGPPAELGVGGDSLWKYLWIDPWNGGDGCVTLIDPSDPKTVYFSAQEGAFRRKDMATDRSRSIRPRLPRNHPGELHFNFVAPMIISPHESNTLLLGGNYLFKSTNRGDRWDVISPNLAEPEDPARHSLAASAVAQSPFEESLIFVGTDKGAFWVSEDGGQQWKDHSNGLPIGYVRHISPSKFEPNRVYVAISGLNYDDFNSYLLVSEDRGRTWKSIATGLPTEPANAVVEDPFFENVLYAATFRGVYVSRDRGGTWAVLGKNLPTCSIADVVVQEQEKDLVVATHGRGIYRMGLTAFYDLQREGLDERNCDHLFPVPTACLPRRTDVRPGLNFRDFEKTPITFWLENEGPVVVSILNSIETSKASTSETPNDEADDVESAEAVAPSDGDKAHAGNRVLTSFEVDGTKGLNQVRWDLVIKRNKSTAPYFINYKNYLSPGTYTLQIKTAGGCILQRPFNVIQTD